MSAITTFISLPGAKARRFISGIGIFAMMVLLAGFLFWSREVNRQGSRVGEQIPDLAVIDKEGRRVSFHHLRGQRFVVLLFRPECRHCRALLLQVEKILSEGPETRPVLAVSLGNARNTFALQGEMALGFPLFCSEGEMPEQMKTRSVPVLLLVSEERRLLAMEKGLRSDGFLRKFLYRERLEAAPPSPVKAEALRR